MSVTQRIQKLAQTVRPKIGCITAYGTWDVSGLVKIRDRNYVPDIEIIHDEKNGVEICYLHDIITGWCEGINEHGIGIVNTALMVGQDEAEKKIVKEVGKKSSDGEKIVNALATDDIEESLKRAKTFKGGIRGHTFIANKDGGYSLEQTSKHDSHVNDLQTTKKYIRTNHGLAYYDAGYTEGDDLISSLYRRERAMDLVQDVDKLENVPSEMMKRRRVERDHPNNMVRDTKNMMTTSQMTLDLENLVLSVYLVPGKVKFKGIVNKLGRKPKVTVKIYDYKDYKPKGDPQSLEVKEKKVTVKKANVEIDVLKKHLQITPSGEFYLNITTSPKINISMRNGRYELWFEVKKNTTKLLGTFKTTNENDFWNRIENLLTTKIPLKIPIVKQKPYDLEQELKYREKLDTERYGPRVDGWGNNKKASEDETRIEQAIGYFPVFVITDEDMVILRQRQADDVMLTTEDARVVARLLVDVNRGMREVPDNKTYKEVQTSMGKVSILGDGLGMGNAGDWALTIGNTPYQKRIKGSRYLLELHLPICRPIN